MTQRFRPFSGGRNEAAIYFRVLLPAPASHLKPGPIAVWRPRSSQPARYTVLGICPNLSRNGRFSPRICVSAQ